MRQESLPISSRSTEIHWQVLMNLSGALGMRWRNSSEEMMIAVADCQLLFWPNGRYHHEIQLLRRSIIGNWHYRGRLPGPYLINHSADCAGISAHWTSHHGILEGRLFGLDRVGFGERCWGCGSRARWVCRNFQLQIGTTTSHRWSIIVCPLRSLIALLTRRSD